LPTTAAAASGAGSGLMKGTPPTTSDEDATKSDFLQGKTFVQKLHAILEVPKYSLIISWNDAGNVATIHDTDAFISTIVPAHFKKSKFGSFIRKMRRWGFSAITKKCTPPSEEGPDTVVEFSSEHFLRDQPDLCLLMKDERHVKKQFSFLDRTVRNVNHENINQGSSVGLNAHYSPNAANYHSDSQRSGVDNSIPPMISPNQQRQSFHNAMPMMNTMMPPPPPSQLNYPPYGYGAPQPPRLGYGPTSPSFQYPAPDGYPPYPQQQHHQMMSQNSQQQKMMQQYQQQEHQEQHQQQRQKMMQLHQEFTSPSADPNLAAVAGSKRKAATSNTETRVSTAKGSGSAAVLTSSSEESAELLPNTKVDVNVQIPSRLDAEQDASTR